MTTARCFRVAFCPLCKLNSPDARSLNEPGALIKLFACGGSSWLKKPAEIPVWVIASMLLYWDQAAACYVGGFLFRRFDRCRLASPLCWNHWTPFSIHLANISISAAGTFVYERLPTVPHLLQPSHPFTGLWAIELFLWPMHEFLFESNHARLGTQTKLNIGVVTRRGTQLAV